MYWIKVLLNLFNWGSLVLPTAESGFLLPRVCPLATNKQKRCWQKGLGGCFFFFTDLTYNSDLSITRRKQGIKPALPSWASASKQSQQATRHFLKALAHGGRLNSATWRGCVFRWTLISAPRGDECSLQCYESLWLNLTFTSPCCEITWCRERGRSLSQSTGPQFSEEEWGELTKAVSKTTSKGKRERK